MGDLVFYKLTLQFNGSKYYGWQIQPNLPTVQGELNQALINIFKSEDIKTIGSGRTDTGVHSRFHVVKVQAPFEIPLDALKKGLNSILPNDILVKSCEKSAEDFLPTNHAKDKEYFYLFSNLEGPEVMLTTAMANISYDIDLDKMLKACKVFEGTYDFKSFMCTGSDPGSTIRTVFYCNIEKVENFSFYDIIPPHYKITIRGNGFLKQMVRLIVGTIWKAGQGKISVEQIQSELENPSGHKLGIVAPASGLYKANVSY